jgi:hypothetical protein
MQFIIQPSERIGDPVAEHTTMSPTLPNISELFSEIICFDSSNATEKFTL